MFVLVENLKSGEIFHEQVENSVFYSLYSLLQEKYNLEVVDNELICNMDQTFYNNKEEALNKEKESLEDCRNMLTRKFGEYTEKAHEFMRNRIARTEKRIAYIDEKI